MFIIYNYLVYIIRILVLLEKNGIFSIGKLKTKERGFIIFFFFSFKFLGGKLEMEEENGIWREYYFALYDGNLLYYKKSHSVFYKIFFFENDTDF